MTDCSNKMELNFILLFLHCFVLHQFRYFSRTERHSIGLPLPCLPETCIFYERDGGKNVEYHRHFLSNMTKSHIFLQKMIDTRLQQIIDLFLS